MAVKITVIKKNYDVDLVREYSSEEILKPCDVMEVGQVFYYNGMRCPEGMCMTAWNSISMAVMALAYRVYEDNEIHWFEHQRISLHNVDIRSCSDALRSVVFRLEVVSNKEYEEAAAKLKDNTGDRE